MGSRSPQNLEFGHFTLLFCRGRPRNVLNVNARAERLFLLINKPFVLWRCRRRRGGVFVRSLIARGDVLIPVFHEVQLVN